MFHNFGSGNEKFMFSGMYRGVVVDNNDPYGFGRCKIKVFGVYDQLSAEQLPWAEYADPMMLGGAPNAGGCFVPLVGSKVWCFFEAGDHTQPVYFAGAPSAKDMPANRFSNPNENTVQYPNNRVFRSGAGHVIEFDDTPGAERIRILHKSGTETIMYANGDMVEHVVGDFTRVVNGSLRETVVGDVLREYGGDNSELIGGDSLRTANGNLSEMSSGGSSYLSGGNVSVDGARIDLNKGAMGIVSAGAVVGFDVPDEIQMTSRNAAVVINEVGSRGAFDEEGETIPEDWPDEESEASVLEPTEILTPATPAAEITEACEIIEEIDYNYQLSNNFTIGDLSIKAVFPHTVKAQGSFDLSGIVCNMKHLCLNILEPLVSQFPNIRINSGFRTGSGSSQHERGQAVDIQVPGFSAADYSDMASWVVANLPVDQFILEHGKSVWLHISYDRTRTTQRGSLLTYYPQSSPAYKSGLKNYYDNGRIIT
tara:strand:- start:7718 stop:9160 length:1443 start_codon:yes stop_codon:yes gene_type:complete